MIVKINKIIRRDGLRFTLKRGLAFLIGHSPLAGRLSFSYYKNLKLVFAPSMLTYVLFASKKERDNDVEIIEKFVKANDTVIDVGAHIGSMSLIAGLIVGDNGSVLAFEPVSKFFNILKQNVKKNNLDNIIKIYPYAVGAETKNVYINNDVADDTTNYISTKGNEVEQITLDDYTKDISVVNFLKIDVEGYELEVLKGATQTLAKTKTIFIEFYTNNLIKLGYNPEDIYNLLIRNFTLYEQESSFQSPFIYKQTETYQINLVGINQNI